MSRGCIIEELSKGGYRDVENLLLLYLTRTDLTNLTLLSNKEGKNLSEKHINKMSVVEDGKRRGWRIGKAEIMSECIK